MAIQGFAFLKLNPGLSTSSLIFVNGYYSEKYH